MSTSTLKPESPAVPLISKAVYLVLAAVTLYFVFTRAVPYLNYGYSVKEYGAQSYLIFLHVIFGMTATLIGPFQFVSAIRKKNVSVHRMMGKIYLLSTFAAALVSWCIIVPKDGNIAYRSGLFFLGFAWISCGTMAYLAIRRQKISIHREWMVRSYVVTLAFVTFRLLYDVLKGYHLDGLGSMMAWGCWALPLFITEIIFQAQKIYSREEPMV